MCWGVMPVERGALLFTFVNVVGHPELEGRTVAQTFRPRAWRVLALGTTSDRSVAASSSVSYGALLLERPRWDWKVNPHHILRAGDRVLMVTTQSDLNVLTGGGPGAP